MTSHFSEITKLVSVPPLTRKAIVDAIAKMNTMENNALYDSIVLSDDKWQKLKGSYGVETPNTEYHYVLGFKVYTYKDEKEYLALISKLRFNKIKFMVVM